MQIRRITVAASVVALSLGATGCGGDETFPRAEFVKQVQANGVTKPVAECTYDRIESDDAIMQELIRADGPNPKISEEISEKMSKVLARCLLAVEDGASTTDPKTTETTTKPKSTTTTKPSKATTTDKE